MKIKAIKIDSSNSNVLSRLKIIENENQKYYYFLTDTYYESVKKNKDINNNDLILLAAPSEKPKAFPSKVQNLNKLQRGDICLFVDRNLNMESLLVLVWEVDINRGTFFGYPVTDQLHLASEKSRIYKSNTGLPFGWDFAVLFEFPGDYEYSNIDSKGYFGNIYQDLDESKYEKGKKININGDAREIERANVFRLVKYYSSEDPIEIKKSIEINNIINERLTNSSELLNKNNE